MIVLNIIILIFFSSILIYIFLIFKKKKKIPIFLIIILLLGFAPIFLSDGIIHYSKDKSEKIFALEMLSAAKHELSNIDALHFPLGLRLRISKLQSSKGACIVKHYSDNGNMLVSEPRSFTGKVTLYSWWFIPAMTFELKCNKDDKQTVQIRRWTDVFFVKD